MKILKSIQKTTTLTHNKNKYTDEYSYQVKYKPPNRFSILIENFFFYLRWTIGFANFIKQ